MREDFLHFLWRTRQFDVSNLTTTDGDAHEILDFGTYNALDSGADFQNVKLKIGDWTWFGSVEMHLKASDWLVHGHQKDAAFGSVILHVVFENDVAIQRTYTAEASSPTPSVIPCLALKNRIPEGIFKKYWTLLHNSDWIPCQQHIQNVNDLTKSKWLERLAVERLERKSAAIQTA